MLLHRRRFCALAAAAAGATIAQQPASAEIGALGINATQLGVRPDSSEDQTRTLQRAVDQAAGARRPLALPPGTYRVGEIRLPAGGSIVGVPGATRLVLIRGTALVSANRVDHVSLVGLTLDGAGHTLPEGRGLVHFSACRSVRVENCTISSSGRIGLALEGTEGTVIGNSLTRSAESGIFSIDARGLLIARNRIHNAANNGIQVWRTESGDDGTQVIDNRIEDVAAKAGGSGQNGNAINVFRAANVIVRGNRINGCAFSAIRGNSASNLQILGNNCTALGETAIYAEFAFEGAIIANNIVDGAADGISVTNFNEGGRLAVVQGNVVRNLLPRGQALVDPNNRLGVGIGIEADTACTGNVIENAPRMGIGVGWGPHLRNVSVTGNIVRRAGIGIGVSVVPGSGAVLIADNMIAQAQRGAILGLEWEKIVTGDLAREGSGAHAHLAIRGNRVQ
jgi:uncharacterized secreted repeat protein (TIGR03808 family)